MANYKLSDFYRLEKIGEGTYGVVYRVKHKSSGIIKAMKRIKLENFEDGIPSTAIREITLLREVQHPNVVCLEQAIMDRGRLYLLFEYLSVDLKKHFDINFKHIGAPPSTVRSYCYQLLQGILFCHNRRIIHRDLKPQNVLVDLERDIVKLADFGLAKSMPFPMRKLTHEVVTLWYRAPEVMLNENTYDGGIDIWSLGCMLAELAMGDPLFPGDSEIDQLFKIFHVLGVPNEETWPGVSNYRDFKPHMYPNWKTKDLTKNVKLMTNLTMKGFDLLKKMLRYAPQYRIDAQQALLHPYFDDLDRESMPATGEEFVGVPLENIPEKYRKFFKSSLELPEGLGDEDENPGVSAPKMSKVQPTTILMGAMACQVLEAASDIPGPSGDVEMPSRGVEPLGNNHDVNMSID